MALPDFVNTELDILAATSPNAGDAPLVALYEADIMSMAAKFAGAGYNATEKVRVAQQLGCIFQNTFTENAISPITGDASEWEDTGQMVMWEILYRNKRLLLVFKVGAGGTPYYTHAILWKRPNGTTYYGNAVSNTEQVITSQQSINLPFVPNDYVVDVIPNPMIGENEWKVKDNADLEKVWVYYIEP